MSYLSMVAKPWLLEAFFPMENSRLCTTMMMMYRQPKIGLVPESPRIHLFQFLGIQN